MKKGLLRLFTEIALAFAALACICVAFASWNTAYAEDAADGDKFILANGKKSSDEDFVYSADITFKDGAQSAGLVFGGSEGVDYWVFAFDRIENRVKLMYFTVGEDGIVTADVIQTAYFIGNDNEEAYTEANKALVVPKVQALTSVNLKVEITYDEDKGVSYGRFYADGIQRFRTDYSGDEWKMCLSSVGDNGVTYTGGVLGYNTFNAESKAEFSDVTVRDIDDTYYAELYRQQYHFSQYSGWNNDPNGLVYYDGWYHLYYQTNPFGTTWSDMYWGHARSRDLLHWENLPVCLFPDDGTDGIGSGNGYAWSGSAMVYTSGTSSVIDSMDLFPNGNGRGLIAFYTRDGAMQDQVIATSDDGGITWVKRKLISQESTTGVTSKIDCRDPKVFKVKDGEGNAAGWGMVVTGMGTDTVWFMHSDDLWNWTTAGSFSIDAPECPDVAYLTLGEEEYAVMTFTARHYIIGKLAYKGGEIIFEDTNGNRITDGESVKQKMDYGPDSYATQTYFIDDATSDYYGKTVSLSWFSGVPGASASIDSGTLANVRDGWNGGGMTIPVIWGLTMRSETLTLTQTPVTVDGADSIKMQIYATSDENLSISVEELNTQLAKISSHRFAIKVTVTNDGSPIAFKVNASDISYVEVGWNSTDGYYVDRTHADTAGLNLKNYPVKFASGVLGDTENKSFYILSDEGGIEVFCENYSVPFYVLTFSSPYAVKASVEASSGAVFTNVGIDSFETVWRDTDSVAPQLLTDVKSAELDFTFRKSVDIMAYSTAGNSVEWTCSGDGEVELAVNDYGATITPVKRGDVTVTITCGDVVKTVPITIYGGEVECDLTFGEDSVISGEWYKDESGIIGENASGDGYLMSATSGTDFFYSAQFDLGNGTAAALIFRAEADMSSYIIANYDKGDGVVKLWSNMREIGRYSKPSGELDLTNIVLSVEVSGKHVTVYLNGESVISTELQDDEPTEGLFGLNVFNTRAYFKTVTLLKSNMEYSSGDLSVNGYMDSAAYKVVNRTLNNANVNPAYFTADGKTLTISEEYFSLLPATGTYYFTVYTALGSYSITVEVMSLPSVAVQNISVEQGTNAVFYIGSESVESVSLGGVALTEGTDYTVADGRLTIFASALSVGENVISFNSHEVTVTVVSVEQVKVDGEKSGSSNLVLIICLSVGGGVLAAAAIAVAVVLIIKKKKRSAKADTEAEENAAETEDGEAETAQSEESEKDQL